MADKNASLPLRGCFALLGPFSFAFKYCFQTGASTAHSACLRQLGFASADSQPPEKRRFGGFLLQLREHPILSKLAAEVREAQAKVVT